MARNITPQMAKVLERLELDRPEIVTLQELADMLLRDGIATPAAMVALRMREKGWLLETGQRGVWEFVPASSAGPYSSVDPLLPVKGFRAAHPQMALSLTFHAAAWALNIADRAPSRIDVVLSRPVGRLALPENLRAHRFEPVLPTIKERSVDVLAPESVIVDMASFPSRVSSWQSALEWLPGIAYEMEADRTLKELSERKMSVIARTGYLIQGMRPDIAQAIADVAKPASKVRFGERGKSLRNDEHWKISDTLLPFDPRDLRNTR